MMVLDIPVQKFPRSVREMIWLIKDSKLKMQVHYKSQNHLIFTIKIPNSKDYFWLSKFEGHLSLNVNMIGSSLTMDAFWTIDI